MLREKDRKSEKKRKRKKRFKIFLITFLSFCFVLCTAFAVYYYCFDGKTYIAYDFHMNHEPFTFASVTNTDAIYSDEQYRTYLEEYGDLSQFDLDEIVQDSYVIPGLKSTRTLDVDKEGEASICTSMTPQGVAVTEKYVLISAFCYMHQHHSVIYVLDKKTHAFIKEIVLNDLSHVGSIAYDSENHNIWVCCYDTVKKTPNVQAFSITALENYSFDDGYQPIEYSMSYPIVTQSRASFMNYRDKALYVGFFSQDKDRDTTVQKFDLDENGGLKTIYYTTEVDSEALPYPSSAIRIERGVQGYAMNDLLLFTIQSYGSASNSHLKIFMNPSIHSDDYIQQALNEDAINDIEIPPMGEEIYFSGRKLYICFESGGYAYRGRDSSHIDRVIVIPW